MNGRQALAFTLLPAAFCFLTVGHAKTPAAAEDANPALRAEAARALAARADPDSLATAAALEYSLKGSSTALEWAEQASNLAPEDATLAWLRLEICTEVPSCDVRKAATTVRWVDAENGAAWLPTLAAAQRDHDVTELERVLADMAEGPRFDVYANRAAVRMYDALRRAHAGLPANYASADWRRLNEALELANSAYVPSFSPLINACRDAAAGSGRRASCLALAETLQRSDTVMAQQVGFALQKRLSGDLQSLRTLAERRRLLEWRAASVNRFDAAALPWLKNSRARSRISRMRSLAREEDVDRAVLNDYKQALTPPEP